MDVEATTSLASGWHYDEDTGALMRDVIRRMGRRCRKWNYRGKGVYQITLTLADRASRALGRLCFDKTRGAFVEPSEMGRLVEAALAELPRQWPGVAVLASQLMPDHLHFDLAVREEQKKPLGAIIGSFKSKTTSRWLELSRTRESAGAEAAEPSLSGVSCAATPFCAAPPSCAAPPFRAATRASRSPSLWASGFVDNILFDARALAASRAYLADNPRRLWEKRAHPELFTVLRDLPVDLGEGFGIGHFAAIGNHNLLKAHSILQVQCSRRFFAYSRDVRGRPVKDASPRVETPEFRESCEGLLEEAAKGAVLVSPCISEGEREIVCRALLRRDDLLCRDVIPRRDACVAVSPRAVHPRVIALANKGFSPLYKPSGKLFDVCAAGNLLMLAPANWAYQPGEKKMTRLDACVLNRLAQLIAGSGAVEIVYKGVCPEDIDRLARDAVGAPVLPRT